MSLNKKYNMVRLQILNIDPLPSLSHICALVVAQEEQQQVVTTSRSPSVKAATFLTSNSNRKHTNNRDLSNLFCEHCKKTKLTWLS